MAYQTTQPGINKPWPLGVITVAAAGTPVAANVHIVKDPAFNQLWFLNTHATATIYLQLNSLAYESTGSQTLWQLAPGAFLFFNANSLGVPAINASWISIDSSASGGTCLITGFQGGGAA